MSAEQSLPPPEAPKGIELSPSNPLAFAKLREFSLAAADFTRPQFDILLPRTDNPIVEAKKAARSLFVSGILGQASNPAELNDAKNDPQGKTLTTKALLPDGTTRSITISTDYEWFMDAEGKGVTKPIIKIDSTVFEENKGDRPVGIENEAYTLTADGVVMKVGQSEPVSAEEITALHADLVSMPPLKYQKKPELLKLVDHIAKPK